MSNSNINEELRQAVRDKDLEKIKALIAAGADVNLRSTCHINEGTLLEETRSVEVAKTLLQCGAYVDACNKFSETPLHTAITRGKNLDFVNVLLQHKADVNATDRKGNTALNLAVKKRCVDLEIIKELLKYGADINIRNRENSVYENCNTPLDNSLRSCSRTKLLIKYTLIRHFDLDYRRIIDLSPYKEFEIYNQLVSYLEECVCEVIQMKTDQRKEGLSLYEIVTNNFNDQLFYNNQLSIKIAKTDFSECYPIYNEIILDKIKPYLERAKLIDKLNKIKFYTEIDIDDKIKGHKIVLDYDSTFYITEYLSNESLLNFITAFDCMNNLNQQDSSTYENSSSNNAKRIKLN